MFHKIKYQMCKVIAAIIVLTINTPICFAEEYKAGQLEVVLDNIMNEKLNKFNIPNAVISVVKQGEVVYKKGFGYADIEAGIPVDPDKTLFRIGSTSKLITWTAVMQLIEQGKLDLDEDVNSYLDFKIPSTLHKSLKRTKIEPITLKHLMTHTPGFEDYPDMIFRISKDELLDLNEYIKRYVPSRIFPAGEVAAYSNYGSALAGYIVERVSGMPFSDYVEKNIFNPLHMDRSTFRQPLDHDIYNDIAKPYRYIEGEYHEGGFEYLLPEPAGSMSTTAADIASFMIAHLGDGSGAEDVFLRPNTLKDMQRQHFTHHEQLSGTTLGFMEGIFNNQRVIFHSGGTMLYSTGLYLLPQHGIGIFISYTGENHLVHSEIFQEFLDYYYPESRTIQEVTLVNNYRNSKKFIGEYHMNRKSVTSKEKINSLLRNTIQVKIDKEGYLIVTNFGESNRFIEVDEGIYTSIKTDRTQDYFGKFNKIVFQKDPYGRMMITTDGPMTYSRAPIYSTISFTAGIFIMSFLIIVGSLLYWVFINILDLFKKRKSYNRFYALSQWVGIIFSAGVIVLILSILSTGQIDPVYELPKEAYIPVKGITMFDFIAKVLYIICIPLTCVTIIAWMKGLWSRMIRFHYTIFNLAALGLIWLLFYWNLLF